MPTRWLYNSDGDPVGYIQNDNVFSLRGDFAGKLYPDNTIWYGDYIGEVWADDRLIADAMKLRGRRPIPSFGGLPSFPGEPEFKGPVTIPLGYRDVDL
jgi:hypothetical protein